MLYTLLRAITGVSLRWFYSRVDTEGLERIPASATVILAVNHPNALVDALVVGVVCPRRLALTARATLFVNPLQAMFLRAAGVVPLIRQKDIADVGAPSDVDRNARAFAALNAALTRGHVALIFPEGITGDHPSLAPLRTGAARIALQANDCGLRDVVVVPVGLTFEHKDAPRTRVFVQVAEPIDVSRWPRRSAEEDVRSLTAEIDRRLRAVTLNFESNDAAERDRALAAHIARLFRGTEATPEVWQRYAPLSDQVAIARRVEEARARLPAVSAKVRSRADALLARLARFRERLGAEGLAIEDLEIDVSLRPGTRFVLRETMAAAVAAPFAIWGWLNHWVPFNLARVLALRFVTTAADPAMNTILAGIGLVLVFYLVQGSLVFTAFGAPAAALYLASLPITADLNFIFRARLKRVLQRARAWLRLRRGGSLRGELNSELAWLRGEALDVEKVLGA